MPPQTRNKSARQLSNMSTPLSVATTRDSDTEMSTRNRNFSIVGNIRDEAHREDSNEREETAGLSENEELEESNEQNGRRKSKRRRQNSKKLIKCRGCSKNKPQVALNLCGACYTEFSRYSKGKTVVCKRCRQFCNPKQVQRGICRICLLDEFIEQRSLQTSSSGRQHKKRRQTISGTTTHKQRKIQESDEEDIQIVEVRYGGGRKNRRRQTLEVMQNAERQQNEEESQIVTIHQHQNQDIQSPVQEFDSPAQPFDSPVQDHSFSENKFTPPHQTSTPVQNPNFSMLMKYEPDEPTQIDPDIECLSD